MCESKAPIWWKTVHWTNNSYKGMHRQLLMQSGYLINVEEKFCSLSDSSGLSQYHLKLTYFESVDGNVFNTPSVNEIFIGVLMQHAKHTREGKK